MQVTTQFNNHLHQVAILRNAQHQDNAANSQVKMEFLTQLLTKSLIQVFTQEMIHLHHLARTLRNAHHQLLAAFNLVKLVSKDWLKSQIN